MDNLLKVETRENKGKGYLKSLRREGFVPAVIYGEDAGNLLVKIDAKELRNLFQAGGQNGLIKLAVKAKDQENNYNVMLKDLSKDAIKGQVIHVDFQQVSLKSKIHAKVAIQLVGEAVGVTKGGTLQHDLREVEVEVLPTDIPESFKVDISNLDVGESVHVKDIEEIPNVTIINDGEAVIASILATRSEQEADEGEGEVAEPGAGTEAEVYTVDTDEVSE